MSIFGFFRIFFLLLNYCYDIMKHFFSGAYLIFGVFIKV